MTSTSTSPSKAARVLVVEDGVVSAKALVLQLQKLEYAVVGVFSSGEEAVENVRALRPDILLVDIALAGRMDGVETAECIMNMIDVPIIYLTSASDDATFQRAKGTNPFAWLSKPVSLENLRRAISMALYRKDILRKLERSEEKYRRIVETMSEGLVILNEDMTVDFANSRFLHMTDTSEEACVGREFSSFLHPDSVNEFLNVLWQVAHKGRLVMQAKLASADGGIPVSVSMSSCSMGDGICEQGEACGYICVVNDLTEQVASAAALREAEDKYRTIFENALDGIYQSLPDGRILDVNPAMAAMFGYDSPAAMVGEVLDAAKYMYERPEDRAPFVEALKNNEQVTRFQARMKKRSGELLWVELSARAVRDADGNVRYFEGICLDITDRKVTEQDLRRRASRDDLTGLYNRVFFREWLHGALQTAARNGNRLGVLYIDLNDFKSVNDSYGHLVGDRVLREMSGRIRERVRECDMVARIGGDEFCVVLEGLHSPDDVCRVSRLISESLSQPVLVGETTLRLGGSVGVAIFPEDGRDADVLLGRADQAMYRAKASCTCGYAFWNEQAFTCAS